MRGTCDECGKRRTLRRCVCPACYPRPGEPKHRGLWLCARCELKQLRECAREEATKPTIVMSFSTSATTTNVEAE